MKRTIEWPLLTPNDIEVKACFRDKNTGDVQVLLYQDSRTAMEAFDRVFGPFGWQMDYYDCGGQLYGRIGVYDDEKGEWVWKGDTGEQSNISAEKGQASDIMKRCAVKWGFARELYDTPKIWVPDNGKGNRYRVSELAYAPGTRRINHIVISDYYGNEVARWDEGGNVMARRQPSAPQQPAPQTDHKSNLDRLKDFFNDMKRRPGVNLQELNKFKDYYKAKADTWEKAFDVNRLWANWMKIAAR